MFAFRTAGPTRVKPARTMWASTAFKRSTGVPPIPPVVGGATTGWVGSPVPTPVPSPLPAMTMRLGEGQPIRRDIARREFKKRSRVIGNSMEGLGVDRTWEGAPLFNRAPNPCSGVSKHVPAVSRNATQSPRGRTDDPRHDLPNPAERRPRRLPRISVP